MLVMELLLLRVHQQVTSSDSAVLLCFIQEDQPKCFLSKQESMNHNSFSSHIKLAPQNLVA